MCAAKKTGGFLDGAYDLQSSEETGAFYDRWAATYDEELTRNGYVTPGRCAQALADLAEDKSLPVADLGCGTGLSGLALRMAGFTCLDGFDYSEQMLARAAAHAGVYRQLARIDLAQPLPVARGAYGHACAAGVLNPGHAPPQALRTILDILPAGGLFAFSLNDHALAAPGFTTAVEASISGGIARCALEAYGEHIPGTGLGATVFVLERL